MDGKPGETRIEPIEGAAAPRPQTDDSSARPKPPSVAEGGTPVENSALSEEELDQLTADIIAALKTVYDPEIPSDIYELGLIYKIDISDDRDVAIDMTLTAPGCPVAGEMPLWVENAVNTVPGVKSTKVTLTFDPPWDQSRMSDEARLALNMF
jgi:FeS assembly SUF system protein